MAAGLLGLVYRELSVAPEISRLRAGENSGDEAIIRTIVALSQKLGLDIIAEGVETTAQGEFLAGEGCPNVQGYLHGKPVDAESFEQDWIKRLRL